MPLTFRDMLANDVANVFVNVNEFGELVTWRTKTGMTSPASPVAAVISPRTMRTASGTKPAARLDVDTIDRIAVTVCRDSSASNSLAERPLVGESIVRDSAIDSDVRPWVFTGECESISEAAATYIFERPRRHIATRG